MSTPAAVPPAGHASSEDEAVAQIVRGRPVGAIALAGLATLVVVALWFGFYLFVFLPRTPAH